MLPQTHFKTVVISDVHLGTKNSKAKELVRFLKRTRCEKLILNGDIIDGWQLRKRGRWGKKHTRFFKSVIKMMERFNTEVIYVRGNHDDFLDAVAPLQIGNLQILNSYVHESHGKRYYVAHGDVFDAITSHFRWLAKLGDLGYLFLLWVNKRYNARRVKKGLSYYSLSQEIKQRVKSAVSYISNFEQELVNLAKVKGFDGIICGHIHHPAISSYDEVYYMNSGDWVESLSALVEHDDGSWHILYYRDLVAEEADLLANNHNQKETYPVAFTVA
ncbi:MAG: UDP-2,3-diacylglucosamine diphosphatase [Bacteroidales bacterium]